MPADDLTLRLILGDQLNPNHSWLRDFQDKVLYVMMEVRQETDYVMHHIQKVLAFFASMRAFAAELGEKGHRVLYIKLDDPANLQTINGNLMRILKKEKVSRFEYLLPDEYRLDEQLKELCKGLSIPWKAYDTEHFLTSRFELREFFRGKDRYVMEPFYRMMRGKFDILMKEGKPLGGVWNFDRENRRPYRGEFSVPEPKRFQNNVRELREMLQERGVKTFGSIEDDVLIWPINRQQAKEALDYFLQNCLPYFGRYQDAMSKEHWSMFHSRLSFALNTKMLHPMEVMKAAVDAYHKDQSYIGLPQVEAFVRQILGWREYMRGVYWARMPEYGKMNHFGHERALPHYYWNGETRMECMRHCILQSLRYAFAHHIQRLMVTGNFALLSGIDPDEVDAWYLGIYIDAVQWVEMPNTRGMSQFADGGIVATKPYISSARYMKKMSDYCRGCYYNPQKRYGPRSCPFNSLFWTFLHRHYDKLKKNPRVAMMLRLFDELPDQERKQILAWGERYLAMLENL
ncbi:MAG: cryptochrome/photolyase family protein [Methanomassiliicoccales archaeon]